MTATLRARSRPDLVRLVVMTQPSFDFGATRPSTTATTSPTVHRQRAGRRDQRRRCGGVQRRACGCAARSRAGTSAAATPTSRSATTRPGARPSLRVQFFANARMRLRPLLQQAPPAPRRRHEGAHLRPPRLLRARRVSSGSRWPTSTPASRSATWPSSATRCCAGWPPTGSLDANGAPPLEPGAAARRRRHQRRHGGVARLPRRARPQRLRLPARRVADVRVQGEAGRARWSPRAITRCLGRRSAASTPSSSSAAAAPATSWPTFDAEPIARAIAAAPVPVLTGLGHEIDRSVADEVAHTSLKTPTACAAHARRGCVGEYLAAVEQRYAADRRRRRGAAIDAAEPGARRAGPPHRPAHPRRRRARRRAARHTGPARVRAGGRAARSADARSPAAAARRAARARVPQLLAAEDRHLAGAREPGPLARPGQRAGPRLEHHPHRRRHGSCVDPADVVAGDVLDHRARPAARSRSRVEPDERHGPPTRERRPAGRRRATPPRSTSSTASCASWRAATSTSTASPTAWPGHRADRASAASASATPGCGSTR